MAKYRFLACDLMSNSVLAELPLKGASFRTQLNSPGDFSAEFPLGDPAMDHIDLISATDPGRVALYVDRDRVLVWGGIIWTRDRGKIAGNEFGSYFTQHREIRDVKVYSGQDSIAVARDLITYAQAKPGGNIGVIVGAETSGILTDAYYYPWQVVKVGQAIMDLSAQDPGFDWAIDVAYDSTGVPTKTFHPAARRGRRFTETGLVFEFPGTIASYDYPEDGSKMANSVTAQGQGAEANMLTSTAADTSLLDGGYPLLEVTNSYSQEIVPANVTKHAAADLKAFRLPVLGMTTTVRAGRDPVLGSYVCGDEARVRITDEWFNNGRAADRSFLGPGLDDYFRIIGIEIHAPDDTRDEEVVITWGNVV